MNKRIGAKGALLDEYERAILELKKVINDITPGELAYVVDSNTANPDCRSVQSILAHVISSGYSYANYIRQLKKVSVNEFTKNLRNNIAEYNIDFSEMLSYNIETFNYFNEEDVEQFENKKKILTRWEQVYDIEQLLEHAIVHILRHRRQIENFKHTMRII